MSELLLVGGVACVLPWAVGADFPQVGLICSSTSKHQTQLTGPPMKSESRMMAMTVPTVLAIQAEQRMTTDSRQPNTSVPAGDARGVRTELLVGPSL